MSGSDNDKANLEDILADYIDRLNSGERIGREEILAAHPIEGPEIVEHLETLLERTVDATPDVPLRTLGDYTLRRQIGRGGMGVVYDAWQHSLDRQVALKVLPAGIAADNRAFVRFMREAKTAAQLQHQNIVAVYGMGVEQNTPYYAMEFVDGETLAQAIAKLKEAEPESPTPFGYKDGAGYFEGLARAFADVADGLQHAHAKGVIHRDIKPSNLILDRERRLRILDFGLAHLEGQESLTGSGDVIGTVQYMSPEQAQVRKIPIDHRTDVYSLGATLYEVLTLRPPFKGKDHHDTLTQIITREPEPLRKRNPRVPRDLETIVLKCLRKDPDDRYGTAEALGQDLRRFARGDAIEARRQTPWERTGMILWRRRKTIAAGILVLAVIMVGLVANGIVLRRAYSSVQEQRNTRNKELYVANMRLATQEWYAGNYSRFSELLDRHRPREGEEDLRGWEWYYLESCRTTPPRMSFNVDPGGVLSVAWSPDDRKVASGSADGVLRIWDVITGACVASFVGESSPIRAVAWSPITDLVATIGQGGTVRIWDLQRKQVVFQEEPATELPPGRELRAAAWSPEGTRLATAAGDGWIKIREATGSLLCTIRASVDCVPSLSWTSNGEYLSAAFREPGEVAVWGTRQWEEAYRFRASDVFLYGVAWSPDGNRLATTTAKHSVEIWNAATRQAETDLPGHTGHVFAVNWSPEGDHIATASQDGSVRIWNTRSSTHEARLLGHTDMVWCAAWNRGGDRVASVSQDGTLKVWTVGEYELPIKGSVAAHSCEGDKFAVLGLEKGDSTVFDAKTGKPISTIAIAEPIVALAFRPFGDALVLCTENAMVLWDLTSQAETLRAKGDEYRNVRAVTCSPDGAWIAAGREGGDLRIYAAQSLEMHKDLPGHTDTVGAVAWSPDGAHLATTSFDLALKIWDCRTWSLVHDLQRDKRLDKSRYATMRDAIAWSPDGRYLAAAGTALFVWDMQVGRRAPVNRSVVAGVFSVAWSPDGSRLATGGADRTVKVWDVSTVNDPHDLITLHGHEWAVHTLAWHVDGHVLLSGDSVTGLKTWDATSAYVSQPGRKGENQ